MTDYLHFSELDSTNDYAKQLIFKEKKTCPFVITTDFQLKGRGTHNKFWYSERDTQLLYSLTTFHESIKIDPRIIIPHTANCVKQMIKSVYETDVEIKEPNDLLINGKKCAGILVESFSRGSKVWIIFGLGLNINNDYFDGDLKYNATSLKIETGKTYDRSALIYPLTELLIQSFNKIV